MSNYITIKLRRGTAAQWTSTNPVLAEGEVGLETDTRKFKVGTGAAAWNSMQYWGGSGGGGAADFIDLGDVPPSYTGQGGKYVKVKTGEDGLEFGTITVAIGDVTGLSAALANLVPYAGASGDVNLGEWGMQLGNIEFDITPTGIPTNQGSVYWDAAAETLAIVMNGTIQRVGEDLFYHVENQSGSSIAKGTAVRFAGTVGNSGKLLIAPFLANGSNPSSYFMGVASEAIANGASGRVQGFGKLRGIDTSAYSEGDILYCSTTVAGAFQTTAPVAPNNIVQVAAVVAASNNGTIFIRPTIGSNINSDEGVRITTPTNGQVLKYNSTSGLWENAADTAGVWGAITGTLSNQTDLQSALDGKVDENAAITGATKTKITYDAKGLVTAGADATTADIADSANKRYVTDADLTKLANTSGTNTGDQNLFSTIAVSGQSNVVADTTGDTLTLVAGSNVTITTDAATDSITISASGGGGGGISDGDKGDITVSSSGTVWTIDNGVVTDAKLSTGIDAAKIADGTVSNTEFQHLNGVTSAIQTQLDGKITAFADPNADRIVFWDDSANAFAALTPSTGLTISGTNMTVRSASATQTGIVELATDAETATGTDTARAVTPAGLASVGYIKADTTATLTNKTIDANGTGNSITNLEVADFAGSAIVTAAETISANNNDTTIPTSAAVKAYADSVAGAGLSDGDKGDITVSSSGTVWTVDNDAITYAKIQNVSAASRLLGRGSAGGAGDVEEITIGTGLSLSGTTLSATGGGGGGADGTVLSPSQITAWQDNYNPSGWANTVGVLRINSNQFHFLSGLTATSDGHTVRIMNSGSFPIGLYNQNTDSTAGNRFAFDDHDVIILPGNSVELFYDGTDSRWRLAAGYALNENSPFVSRYWNEAFSTNQGELGSAANMWPSTGTYQSDQVAFNFNGGRAGVVRASTGTGSTNTAGFYLGSNETIEFNDGTASGYQEFRAVMFTPAALADATNDYFIHAGWLDSNSATPADGAWLRYNYNENSGQWQRVTGNAGTRTTNNSAVALTTSTWLSIRVVMYPNNTAEFYVNGTSLGRNTTNLPGANRDYSFGCYIRKTAGTTAREIAIDGVGFTIVKYTK